MITNVSHQIAVQIQAKQIFTAKIFKRL